MSHDDQFYPCNKRECRILMSLSGDALAEYKRLRHAGATVREALTTAAPTRDYRDFDD